MGTANHRHPDRPHGSDTSLRGRSALAHLFCAYDAGNSGPRRSFTHEYRRSLPKLRAASSTIDPQSGKEVIL
jgi:hypothetical protein